MDLATHLKLSVTVEFNEKDSFVPIMRKTSQKAGQK